MGSQTATPVEPQLVCRRQPAPSCHTAIACVLFSLYRALSVVTGRGHHLACYRWRSRAIFLNSAQCYGPPSTRIRGEGRVVQYHSTFWPHAGKPLVDRFKNGSGSDPFRVPYSSYSGSYHAILVRGMPLNLPLVRHPF